MGTGIVFGNLLFTTTERLIVIRRTDLRSTPHLCILLGTESGEIDLHLKYESPRNDETSTYEPLMKFSKSALGEFIEDRFRDLEPQLFDFLRRFSKRTRPGWLARNGYLIALFHEEAMKSSLYAAAPKVRGKHRADIQKMQRLFTTVDPSLITWLDPAVLHTPEMQNYRELFFAVGSRGKRRMIPLRYVAIRTRTPAWVGLDALARGLPQLLETLVPTELKEQLKVVWYRIYGALRLNEIGLTRD